MHWNTATKSLDNIATATVNTSEGEKCGNKEKGTNIGKGKEFHICKVCKKMFAWKNSLSMHEKNYHSKAESSCSQSVSVSRKVNKRRNKTIGSWTFACSPSQLLKMCPSHTELQWQWMMDVVCCQL